MRVQDFMTKRVETISTGESAEEALARMRRKRIHHLVVTAGKEILGVVSDRDLTERSVEGRQETVEEAMTRGVATASPKMSMRQAANRMRGRGIGCLPVVEGGTLVGIITTTDLLDLIGRGAQGPSPKGRRWILKGRGPRRKLIAGRKGIPAR